MGYFDDLLVQGVLGGTGVTMLEYPLEQASELLGWIQEGFKALSFSAEVPRSDSDTCLGRFDPDFGGPSGCNSDFRAVPLTYVL